MNRTTHVFACLTAAGALACTNAVYAVTVQPSPSALISVETGGQTATLPVELFRTDKGWGWGINVETAEYKIEGGGTLNPDPSIAYGLAVIDFGAPSVFGFVFGTPIVPTGPGTTVSASIGGALTDFTGDVVALTPTGSHVQTSSVGFPMTPMGVDVGPALSAPASRPGSVNAYGPYTAGPTVGPSGPWTFLTVSAIFGLSGDGDIAALTGFAQIDTATTTVPDSGPGLWGWATLGLLLACRNEKVRQGFRAQPRSA
ncbi:MAG: hypothetical protein AB9869_37465 [Verrucomicrobiia bacterium]